MDENKYKESLNLLFYEGDMLWKIVSTFMLVHTILIAFIASTSFKDPIQIFGWDIHGFIVSIFGLILVFPWWGTYVRNTDYYHFRMAQAKSCEPEGWNLLNKDGEDFAEGHEVTIEGRMRKKYDKLQWFGELFIED